MRSGLANENCSKGYENMVKDLSRAAASQNSSVKGHNETLNTSQPADEEYNNNNLVTPYRYA